MERWHHASGALYPPSCCSCVLLARANPEIRFCHHQRMHCLLCKVHMGWRPRLSLQACKLPGRDSMLLLWLSSS